MIDENEKIFRDKFETLLSAARSGNYQQISENYDFLEQNYRNIDGGLFYFIHSLIIRSNFEKEIDHTNECKLYLQKCIDVCNDTQNLKIRTLKVMALGYLSVLDKNFELNIIENCKKNINELITNPLSFTENEFFTTERIIGNLYGIISDYDEIIDEYNESISNLEKAVEFFKIDNDSTSLVYLLTKISRIATLTEDRNKAFSNIKLAEELVKDKHEASFFLQYKVYFYFGYAYDNFKYKSSLNYYLKANNIWKKMFDNKSDPKALINIGYLFERMNKLNQAYDYYNQSLEYYLSNSKDDADYSYCGLGDIELLRGNFEKAKEFFVRGLDIVDRKKPEIFDLNNTYLTLYQIDRKRKIVYDLAQNRIFGRLWLFTLFQQENTLDKIFDSTFWLAIRNSIELFWEDYDKSKNLEKHIYKDHWVWKRIINKMYSHIDTETHLNYLVGPNNLNLKIKDFKQSNLSDLNSEKPLWFIEFPLKITPNEKYFVCRINSAITTKTGYSEYLPSLDNTTLKIEELYLVLKSKLFNDQIIDIRFENLTEMVNEHWNTDIRIFKINDSVKGEDTLDINYSIRAVLSIFEGNEYSKHKTKEIKSSTNKLSIPIVRKNGIQKLQKVRYRNLNLLTWLIALTSILMSVFNFFLNVNGIEGLLTGVTSAYLNNGFNTFIFSVLIIIIAFFLISLLNFTFKPDKIRLNDRI